jgi:hypothetical protein
MAKHQEVTHLPASRLFRLAPIAFTTVAALAAPARAAVPHTVVPGETLWSIATANNFTTRTVAAYNGLSEDAPVYVGETIEIPTESEGATALAAAGTAVPASTEPVSTSPTTVASATNPSWTAPIYCPSCSSGEAYLASNAAVNWEAMRQASLATYGIDLYPAGDLSAYRSYAQQAQLYDAYISGLGPLAAPPGTSSHEYGSAVDLADPAMATVIDQIGAAYGWAKTEASNEWWHVNYVGP